MDRGMNTRNKDKPDNEEGLSSAEEEIVMDTKVGDKVTDKDTSNDEIIDVKDDQIRDIVQNKVLNFVPVEITNNEEQNNTTSDLNEKQNGNFTVNIKDDNPEPLKQEKSVDINVSSNVPPADQDELSSQFENDFVNVTYKNASNDQKVVNDEKIPIKKVKLSIKKIIPILTDQFRLELRKMTSLTIQQKVDNRKMLKPEEIRVNCLMIIQFDSVKTKIFTNLNKTARVK